MIQVSRLPKPAILNGKATEWRDAYLKARNAYEADKSPANKSAVERCEGKYRHPNIKGSLITMFGGKCAYCESYILHIDYSAIEHFKPKAKFPELCFDWDNLLLSCNVCNDAKHKADKFPDADAGGPFVNPVNDDPDSFFDFEFDGSTGTANVIAKNSRAEITENEIGLNRPDLVRHRSSIVRKMVLLALKARDGDTEFRDEIRRCCNGAEEYAAFARALVRRFNL